MRISNNGVCLAALLGAWLVGASSATAAAPVSDVAALLAKGHAAYLAGNAEAALLSYEQAKAAAPGEASIHFYIGCALARQGRDDEAVVALQTAASVNGNRDPRLANRLGVFRGLLEERRQKWEAAVAAYAAVVEHGAEPAAVVAAAKSRKEVLGARARLWEACAPVRQRIADAQ